MKKAVLTIIIFILLASTAYTLEIGDTSASFANMDLNGKFLFSKNHIGKGWIIVDFFATYCVPCKEEIPELELILEEFGNNPVQCFIMATDKEGPAIVSPYFKETPTSLTVLIDRYMVTAKRFGVESIPTVFLINSEGRIVFKAVGYSEEIINEIRSILTEAFSG